MLKTFARKGFRTIKTNPKHIKFYFESDGRVSQFRAHCSRGSHGKTVSPFHIKQMAQQLKLTKEEFMKFYECPYKKEDYIRLVREKLGPDPLDLL